MPLQSLPSDFLTTMEEYVRDAPKTLDPSASGRRPGATPASAGATGGATAAAAAPPAATRSSTLARQGGTTSSALAGVCLTWEQGVRWTGRSVQQGKGRKAGRPIHDVPSLSR